MTFFINLTVKCNIYFGLKSGKTCKIIHMLTKLSQWVSMRFCPLLHGLLSKSHDLRCYIKPRRYSLFYISIKTQDYVISPYQVHLSKTTKHWDGFVSHCKDVPMVRLDYLTLTFKFTRSVYSFLHRPVRDSVRVSPDKWRDYRENHEFLNPSCLCALLKLPRMQATWSRWSRANRLWWIRYQYCIQKAETYDGTRTRDRVDRRDGKKPDREVNSTIQNLNSIKS